MATKTRDPDYSAEKRNNISKINISLNKHFATLRFINGTPTFVSSRWLLSFKIIYMTVHNYWHDRTPFL